MRVGLESSRIFAAADTNLKPWPGMGDVNETAEPYPANRLANLFGRQKKFQSKGPAWRSDGEEERRAVEDALVSYETELATRLYQVLDRRAAAEELITAWWLKHGIPADPAKLALALYEAEAVTENYRMRRRNRLARLKEIRRIRRMSNHTKPVILGRLKEGGNMTASELARSTGFSLDAIRQQLSRMAKSGEIIRVRCGLYGSAGVSPVFDGNTPKC
jgi:hypothetical protein